MAKNNGGGNDTAIALGLIVAVIIAGCVCSKLLPFLVIHLGR